jgi:hypothetical protein
MKKRTLLSACYKMAILAIALNLVGLNSASALTPSQWPKCDCPDEFKALLASWDFENLTPGFYPGVPASYVSPWVTVSDLQGPSPAHIGSANGSQWGCFGGFPADGSAGTIGFKMEYTANELATFCGVSFDVFSEGTLEGLHGPTKFFMTVYANGDAVWQSESVNLIPGANNAFNWNIANPDGIDLNGDGISLTGSNFDWMNLTAGDTLAFEITAMGANTTAVGLDIDNLQVFACVPEPSSALMILIAGMVLRTRFRSTRHVKA